MNRNDGASLDTEMLSGTELCPAAVSCLPPCIMSPNVTRMDYLSCLGDPSTTAPAFSLQSLLRLSAGPLPEKLIRATRGNELSLLE